MHSDCTELTRALKTVSCFFLFRCDRNWSRVHKAIPVLTEFETDIFLHADDLFEIPPVIPETVLRNNVIAIEPQISGKFPRIR